MPMKYLISVAKDDPMNIKSFQTAGTGKKKIWENSTMDWQIQLVIQIHAGGFVFYLWGGHYRSFY